MDDEAAIEARLEQDETMVVVVEAKEGGADKVASSASHSLLRPNEEEIRSRLRGLSH